MQWIPERVGIADKKMDDVLEKKATQLNNGPNKVTYAILSGINSVSKSE